VVRNEHGRSGNRQAEIDLVSTGNSKTVQRLLHDARKIAERAGDILRLRCNAPAAWTREWEWDLCYLQVLNINCPT
jgi:hypothetical protein